MQHIHEDQAMARKVPVERLTIDEIRRPLEEPTRLLIRAYKLGVFDEAFEAFADWFIDAKITREEAVKRLREIVEKAEKEGKAEKR